MPDQTLYANVEDLTIGGYQTFQTYALQAQDAAYQAVSALNQFDPTPLSVNVSFDVAGGPGTFVPPPRPNVSIRPFEIPDDAYPSDLELEPVSFDSSVLNESFPSPPPNTYANYAPPTKPGQLTATPPGDPPLLDEIIIPGPPSDPNVERPEFFRVEVPKPREIELPLFDGDRPSLTIDAPSQTFSFSETRYSSALLDQVRSRISTMLLGGTGLPAAIEQALFDRARTQEETNALRAMQEVEEEFANRGWDEPSGALANRKMLVVQNNQNQKNQLRRQIEIENKQIEIENLRFAVTQGIALEQVLISAHLAFEQRRFEAARYAFEVVLSVFNAQIARFNAQVQAYQADAQVFRDRVQAAIAQVELYRAEIEAQRVIGELNKTLAERYDIEVRAALGLIEIYRTRILAANAALDGQRLKLDAHRAKVETYGALVRAWEVEWTGYASQVRAELGRVEAADIAARTYATRVGAVQTKYQTAVAKLQGDVSIQQLAIAKFEAEMRRLLGFAELARAQVAADATSAQANATLYDADGRMAQAESASKDRSYQLVVEKARAEADIALKNGEINLQGFIQASAQSLEALRTVAATTAQLAASAMSAINISGSLSGQVSASDSSSDIRSKSADFEGNGTVSWV